jgi:hypothetical protein
MAFATSKSAVFAAVSSTNSNDSWKAVGFINLYLPTVGGKEKKLGAIPLRASRPAEKELSDWLNKKAENVASMASVLVVEFNDSEASNADQFDLGFAPAAPVDGAENTGYINFYLPSKDGSRRKLGFVAIKESENAPMLGWLKDDPENVKVVASRLIVKYQSAESPARGFALV